MQKFISLLSLAMMLGLVGCGNDEPAPVQSRPDTSQNEPQPIPDGAGQAFEDARQLVPEMIENFQGWPIDSLPPSLTDTSYDIYAVTLLWGQLAPVPNTEAIDWSGTLGVNAEAVVHVLAPIDFEAGQDSILLHDAVHFAAWQSVTQGDLDGVACLVFLKRGIEYFAAPWLSFETSPFTHTWDFGELENLAAWYQVGPNAGLAIYARKLQINQCPSGTFDGTWVKANNTGDSGTFSGLWKDADGEAINTFAGTFWTNNDGSRQFHGWISGLFLTVIEGEMDGRWYYDDPTMCPMCGQGRGIMEGTYRLVNQNAAAGKFVGVFGDYGIAVDQLELDLDGVWREHCPGFAKWYLGDE